MATATKDNLSTTYTLLIFGIVLIIFLAGYMAGRPDKDENK
jgi:hypothetical protein